MNRKLRKLAYRVGKIIQDHGPDSQEVFQFALEHPLTMTLILKRLKKDNDEAVANIVKATQDEPKAE